jgi:hypothetical protein
MRLRLLLATVIGLAFAMTGVASAQEEGGSTVTVVHDIASLGPVAIIVDGEVAVPSLAYGESAGPVDFEAGTYEVAVADATAPTVPLLGPVDLTLEAGIAYAITATLVDGTPDLVVEEEPLVETGTLAFQHDITGGPTVGVVVLPFGEEDDAVDLGTVDAGESFEQDLPVGDHVLVITDEAGEQDLGSTEFSIAADTTTTVRASSVLGTPAPSPSETATATASPTPIRTPNRVDTGAGGTEGNGGNTAVLVLAGLAAGAVAVATTRKRAA